MDNRNLATRIKELRARKGFSQELLSEESKLSLRTIQRIEKGETVPRGDTLIKLTNALGVTPDDILDWGKIEDQGYLTLLNLSALTAIFVHPILGIIIPLAMWILKKDKINRVDDYGKKLINFEITWVILIYVFFIVISKGSFIYFGFNFFSLLPGLLKIGHDQESLYLAAFSIIYFYNLFIILINMRRIKKQLKSKYFPAIPILGQ